MQGPQVTQVPVGPVVQQAPAPYAPYQTNDWTGAITGLFTAIMPLIVVMMLFKMLGPMMEGIARR